MKSATGLCCGKCNWNKRFGLFRRQEYVTRLWAVCIFAAVPVLAADNRLSSLLGSIEERYNHAKSLRLEFVQTYAGARSPAQKESGTIWLMKPGRMRWEYERPSGKLFLSDGKNVYLYTPQDHRATRSKLKESDDMRAPLAFLLGKLNFQKEFRSFESRAENGGTWIVALPKSENLAYTKVEFFALPTGEIRLVRVTGQDQSRLEFQFSGERMNVPVKPDEFVFHPPAGVEVVAGVEP